LREEVGAQRRVRDSLRESDCELAERAPHPDLLPVKDGEKEMESDTALRFEPR
jgi:hypothetical protein